MLISPFLKIWMWLIVSTKIKLNITKFLFLKRSKKWKVLLKTKQLTSYSISVIKLIRPRVKMFISKLMLQPVWVAFHYWCMAVASPSAQAPSMSILWQTSKLPCDNEQVLKTPPIALCSLVKSFLFDFLFNNEKEPYLGNILQSTKEHEI